MIRSHRPVLRRMLGATAALAFALGADGAPANDGAEAIKAAFIYNFARFTEWPDDSFAQTGNRLRVCYRRGDPLSDELENLGGKSVGPRSIETVAVAPREPFPASCHIAVLPPADVPASAAPVHGLLTVGDIGAIGGSGAAVGLVQVGRQVRFQVDTEHLELSGLRMSSKLLRLAVRVVR